MEAILLNGLIPYAYECFRDEKEIVTPAQSVLLKLLVSVYRPQPALPNPTQGEWIQGGLQNMPTPYTYRNGSHPPPPREDGYDDPPPIESSIPTFFVNVFRRQVMGPVVNIIRLQGAIRRGEQGKDQFEYSLWDLDRIYEGVYQFMELFVLFTEDDTAKKVLHGAGDGLVVDLVQLLGELEKAIPRYIAAKANKPVQTPAPPPPPPQPEPKQNAAVENKYAVERPFDIGPGGDNEDAEYDDPEDDQDNERDLVEPDEFTWPNIKRFLVILVSSLAWHNTHVQDLVRHHGGVQAVLNQCKIDDDNPCMSSLLFRLLFRRICRADCSSDIREHAILCIRSLLQGNIENQKIVEELNAKDTVPSEVLDKHGYEPYIDEKGKVRLRRSGEQ